MNPDTVKARNASAARESPWWTPGEVTVESGSYCRKLHNIAQAVEVALKSSQSEFYRHCTLRVVYRGPDAALTREPRARGVRGDYVHRCLYVCNGEWVGVGVGVGG